MDFKEIILAQLRLLPKEIVLFKDGETEYTVSMMMFLIDANYKSEIVKSWFSFVMHHSLLVIDDC